MATNGYGGIVDDSPKADGVSQSALIKALCDHVDYWGLWLASLICAASERPVSGWFAAGFLLLAIAKMYQIKRGA